MIVPFHTGGIYMPYIRNLSIDMQNGHILILLCPLNFVPDILVVQGYVAAGQISCHAT